MKLKMSHDGIQTVNVDVMGAVLKATKADDSHNLIFLKEIQRIAIKRNRITKADYDFVIDYLRGHK